MNMTIVAEFTLAYGGPLFILNSDSRNGHETVQAIFFLCIQPKALQIIICANKQLIVIDWKASNTNSITTGRLEFEYIIGNIYVALIETMLEFWKTFLQYWNCLAIVFEINVTTTPVLWPCIGSSMLTKRFILTGSYTETIGLINFGELYHIIYVIKKSMHPWEIVKGNVATWYDFIIKCTLAFLTSIFSKTGTVSCLLFHNILTWFQV